MGILSRIIRLCRADLHGVLDRMEDKGLLLKQYLREMSDELERSDSRLARLNASRDQVRRETERVGRELAGLEKDVESAVSQGRDDLARLLIRKKKPLAHHRGELNRHLEEMDREIADTARVLEDRKIQYREIKLKVDEFFREAESRKWNRGLTLSIENALADETGADEVELELLEKKAALGL